MLLRTKNSAIGHAKSLQTEAGVSEPVDVGGTRANTLKFSLNNSTLTC